MTLKVYGIPNCGTCKKAMQWLDKNDVAYEFINTKENPPSKEKIANWVNTLGFKPMRNTSGKSYRALGEQRNTWESDLASEALRDRWITEFSQDAMLLKRPLFVKNEQAILVGFRASEEELKTKLLD
ncbi:Transcriptional regulator, Spx/MgsR family [Hyella patelloides LEGE 07179]|uniref:Transcriptional regulator, Spx/MgsR family n=1 Tax=Hyella patelloides LEGE 07179 TaxID=945734 RepID=A0A563VZ76_9CYAN|nr:Spx/MgsR family RNA polymerase-binding regulatory protein [Hyella patelloides]VEP16726.1 Transcriptional regulator, Spx/MgsR family [Hyella patelloides LEGE 07179]